MATDIPSRSQRQSANPPHRDWGSAPSRTWKISAFLLGGLAIVAAAAVAWYDPADESSRDLAPKLTHAVSRGELLVTVTEQGTLESSDNTEIKCKVRGENTIIWVIESGTHVKAGDELLRLDTLQIEEQIAERTKFAHLARSEAERAKADAARAKLAISEYVEGRYRSELMTMEKDLAIAESNLLTARNMLGHSKMMAESGYVSELDVTEREFAVRRASLNMEVTKAGIDVLKEFTKAEELATLKGNLAASQAKYEADKERSYADDLRRDRALEELTHCVVRAERSGIVIHPSAEAWKEAPEIEEGATVHKNQVLLLMPDLSKMQVKIGIHESVIDRIHAGLGARVTLLDKTVDAKVSSVSPAARPAGWWNGNAVKYDTIVALPTMQDLKTGMSAEVEVIIARHQNVLTVPVSAVLETGLGYICWVESDQGTQQRKLTLGDSGDMMVVVKAGLNEGEQVVLNPLDSIEEAQTAAAKTLDKRKTTSPSATNPTIAPKAAARATDE